MKKIIKILSLTFVFALSFANLSLAQNNTDVKLDTSVKVESDNLKLDTGLKSSSSVVEKNRENDKDDDESKDLSIKEEESNKEGNQATGESVSLEHRSAVAAYVKGLLDISDKNKSIGAEVKVIAKSQNDDSLKSEEAVIKVSSRSKFRTFLFGSDYKNIGVLRSLMVKTNNEIKQLKSLVEKVTLPEVKTELETQIKLMETEQAQIAAFINTHEEKFSLFGWLRSK